MSLPRRTTAPTSSSTGAPPSMTWRPAHVLALERADFLKSDLMIVSAPTPFEAADCKELVSNAPAVVERYFPNYAAVYAQRGWKMYQAIDRVYVSRKIQDVLGMKFRVSFADQIM